MVFKVLVSSFACTLSGDCASSNLTISSCGNEFGLIEGQICRQRMQALNKDRPLSPLEEADLTIRGIA
jgi:hypothetical protein